MEFPSLRYPAIIATKGLPCTGKTYVAASIATWSGGPILRMDDILDKLHSKGDNNGGTEAELLHRLAFEILCNMAACQLLDNFAKCKCVVIKSRLCSTFELDQLIQLAGLGSEEDTPHPLVIIESQMSNEFRWQSHFDDDDYTRFWYRPRKWDEIEMARIDYDAQDWDRYFLQSISKLPRGHQHLVRRLVLDAANFDLILQDSASREMTRPFADGIRFLLTGSDDELHKFLPVVEFDDLRRFLLEKELNTPRERSKYLCNNDRGCVFKYVEEREWLELEVYKDSYCGACETQVLGPGYACYFCTLALHTSCAETPKMTNISKVPYLDVFKWGEFDTYHFPQTYSCKSCRETGKAYPKECKSCIFLMHLKCRLMPTILKHDSHPKHFLSISLESRHYRCKACGHGGLNSCYACKICNYNYHSRCVALPREMEHEHGGYDHLMKLMYSLDGMEEQEDFWCDICCEDMDRKLWFYYCQSCPYYVAHIDKDSKLPCGSP